MHLFRTTLRTLALTAALLAHSANAGDSKHSHGDHGAHHGEAKAGALTITGAYARATIGNAPNSAAYFEIASTGGADRLLGAATPAARAVELHTTVKTGDIMKMQKIDAIEVPAGGTAELAPGGMHVMLLGVTEKLKDGAMIPLTLTFETTGVVEMMIPVRKAGHGGHNHSGHSHGSGS
ncbi:MAG: copper chaperone PCu(A)C [Pseudomonadota bacterium]